MLTYFITYCNELLVNAQRNRAGDGDAAVLLSAAAVNWCIRDAGSVPQPT